MLISDESTGIVLVSWICGMTRPVGTKQQIIKKWMLQQFIYSPPVMEKSFLVPISIELSYCSY